MRDAGLGVGAVIQIVFPLASYSPTYTITQWGANVSLKSASGATSTLHIDRVRRCVAEGACVVLRPAPRPTPERVVPPERPLTIQEAMVLAGVSRRTMHNWINADKVKYLRLAGGRVRIDPASLFRAGNDGRATELT